MGKVAFVFPGQASQYPGMGKDQAEKYPAAKAVFAEADQALGFSISKMCFEGTEEELKLTANTQPAILTCSVAVHRVLAERGLTPDFVAGHSLGEYSALVAAGIRERAGVSVGMSVTGIAGPGGATETKPIGLVYIGLAGEAGDSITREFRLHGDRQVIKQRSSQAALDLLRRWLLGRGKI